MRAVNLKADMPPVHEALQRLESELENARHQGESLLKIIHGYGSTGSGGDIRVAVQRRLAELTSEGKIRDCIFGEDWSKSNARAWELLKSQPQLKGDSDLGRKNSGITVVLL